MSIVLLKDHKAFEKKHVFRDEYEITEIHSLAGHLQSILKIEDNFFFRDFWNLILLDADFYEKVFAGSLGHFPLMHWIEDAQRKVENPDNSLIRVEVYHDIDIHDYKHFKGRKNGKSKNTLPDRVMNATVGFHGIGPHTCEQTGFFTPEQNWAIEFTPICQYMDIPLRLDEKVKIDFAGFFGKNRPKPIDAGTKDFTVYDVLEAILNEITFCGPPDDRDEKLADLNGRVEDLKEELDGDNEEK
jgi:hypothetical protein